MSVLGLSELKNRFPQELSGGQQQRCSIGRALIKNPKLLLCDEPTGTLDYKTSKNILELLENIIALSMALVVALCSSGGSIEKTIHTAWAICNVEDGSFETYVPLSNRNFKELSTLDAVVEPMVYFDADADSGTVLRLFANRSKIDIPYAESGRLPTEKKDLFLEKLFAKNHGIAVGDSIKIDNYIVAVCCTGTFPDYCYVKQNTGDVAANDAFSVAAAVTGDPWNRLQGTHKSLH